MSRMSPSLGKRLEMLLLLLMLIGLGGWLASRVFLRPGGRPPSSILEELQLPPSQAPLIDEILNTPEPPPAAQPTAALPPAAEPAPEPLDISQWLILPPSPEPRLPEITLTPSETAPPTEIPSPLPPEDAARLPESDDEPAVDTGPGIWVRNPRLGENPVRVEDTASVTGEQLSQMARIRNRSTDPRYPAPNFEITGTGQGRLGTYVIANGRLVQVEGHLASPEQPPRAWRLIRATQNEVFWQPLE